LHGLVYGPSTLFQQSTCLYFCQYHAVFVIVVLQCNLKSGIVILPALLFLLRVDLAIWSILHFPCEFLIVFLVRCHWNIYWYCIEIWYSWPLELQKWMISRYRFYTYLHTNFRALRFLLDNSDGDLLHCIPRESILRYKD
jgi:hypothetical protein